MDTTTAMETTSTSSAINNEATAAILTAAAKDATVQCIWSETRWSSIASNEFFKFIARFSGRRRNLGMNLEVIILLVIISLFSTSEACSSRTVPKQRPPPPTPTPRPNITFPTYACPSTYAAWYCLNSATCFSVKIGEEVLYNCECAVGYEGPRCEYKEIDGSYLPTRPRAMLEKASIASGATLALLVVIILCLTWYMRCQQKQKARRLESSDCGMDDVDGVVMMPIKRPFGPHHQYTLPMTSTFKR